MMSDKMREDFEKWYMRIHPHINYMLRTPTDGYANRHAQELWGIWQAAKSVLVVGEPVAWGVASKYDGSIWIVVESPQEAERIASDHDDAPIPLYSAPPVTEAELERLRKDAERYRWLRDRMVGAHFDFDDEGMVILAFEMPDTARISADCDETIDSAAAIAASKNET